jgi:hypothetical protein
VEEGYCEGGEEEEEDSVVDHSVGWDRSDCNGIDCRYYGSEGRGGKGHEEMRTV